MFLAMLYVAFCEYLPHPDTINNSVFSPVDLLLKRRMQECFSRFLSVMDPNGKQQKQFHLNINDLPVELLHNIFSRLPSTFDAIKVSPVCQKWRNLWSFTSSINFNQSLYPPRDSPIETARSFAEFINRILILRSHTPITNFRLLFNFTESKYARDVNSWIQYAIDQHTLEVDLDFVVNLTESEHTDDEDDEDDDDDFDCYTFSFSILTNSGVEMLKLRCCELSFTSNLNGDSRFTSLKSIVFDTVLLTEEHISDLLLECVNLEKLVLDTILGVHDLKICSSSLQELSIIGLMCDQGSLELHTPRLGIIRMVSVHLGRYTFEAIGSLAEAYLSEMRWSRVVSHFGNVPHLFVGNPCFKHFSYGKEDDLLLHQDGAKTQG